MAVEQIRRPKVYTDGYRTIVSYPRAGKSDYQEVFLDCRIGLVWPSANNPGYYCIFGLEDKRRPDRRWPMKLLREASSPTLTKLFTKMARDSREYQAKWLLADMAGKELEENELGRFITRRGIDYMELFPCEDFSGLSEGLPQLSELVESGLLSIDPRTVLYGQMDTTQADDLNRTNAGVPREQRLYALHALMHIVTGYQMYPFNKPKKPRIEQRRRSGYGG